MKKNKIIRILSILIFGIIIIGLSTNVFATEINPGNYKPPNPLAGDWVEAKTIVNPIIGMLKTVGITIAVIAIAIMGIKYMIGSVEEKAEYKKTMIPYMIGVILIVAVTQFVGIIAEIVTNIS